MKSVSELMKFSQNCELKRDENKINVLAVQPGLSQNEYYSLIQPKYYFSNNEKINYQVSRITSYKDLSNVDLLLTEALFADIILLPQSLQDYEVLVKAAKFYNKTVRIGMLQEVDPELLTKTMLTTTFIKDLKDKDISIDDYFSQLKNRMKSNINLVDFIIVSSPGLYQNLNKLKPIFYLKSLPLPNIVLENVTPLMSTREQYDQGFLSILIDADVDNVDNINKFLNKLKEKNLENVYVNIIGEFKSNIDFHYQLYPDSSIIHRGKIIKEINPDIYIDLSKANGPNISSYNAATINEMLIFNIYPIINIKHNFEGIHPEVGKYKNINDLISLVEKIKASDIIKLEEKVIKKMKLDYILAIDDIEDDYMRFLLKIC